MSKFIYIEKDFDAGLRMFDELETIKKKMVTIMEQAITIIATRANRSAFLGTKLTNLATALLVLKSLVSCAGV